MAKITITPRSRCHLTTAESEQQSVDLNVAIVPAWMRGDKGEQGEQGIQGPKGDTGAAGIDGIDGATGLKGDQGIQGIQGPKGDQGIQGIQGLKGDKGDQGIQGLQGLKGDKGDTGANGIDGIDGATGLKGDQGIQGIQGPKGDQGIQGLKGDKGDQGIQGLQGLKGDKGDTGSIGLTGAKGDQGIQGLQGLKGDKGDTGAAGIDGIDGANGIDGAIGATGVKGDQGIQGLKGDKGDQGIQGPEGAKGEKGMMGLIGADGAKGDKGDAGADGIDGLDGAKGDKGDQGIKGDTPPLTQALGQSTTSATSQKLVTDELAKYYSSLAVQSRGMNLITNGTGLLNNNYNFSQFTFNPTELYTGGGSFTNNTPSAAVFIDELLPVNPAKYYALEVYLKSISLSSNNLAYVFSASYDADGLVVGPEHYTWDNNVTTLAAPLSVGDMVIQLVSAQDWDKSGNVDKRHIKIHEYTNSRGYKWGEKTYSRNEMSEAYSNSDINLTTNTITLRRAWSVANPESSDGSWSVGTKIGTSYRGGSWQYFTNLSNAPIPKSWIKGSGVIGGSDPSVNLGVMTTNTFPTGTAFIKIGFLLNRGVGTGNTTAISALHFTEITPSNLQGQWQGVYNTTTALGANMVVDANGNLLRSTSSERYKDILADVVLSDGLYEQAMQLKPILYRSTADADNPRHHYYSFSAEVMGAFDPAFALWRYTELVDEVVTDADGTEITIQKEVKLDKPVAEGLNINAILALNHAISIKQHKKQLELERRILDLEQLKEDK